MTIKKISPFISLLILLPMQSSLASSCFINVVGYKHEVDMERFRWISDSAPKKIKIKRKEPYPAVGVGSMRELFHYDILGHNQTGYVKLPVVFLDEYESSLTTVGNRTSIFVDGNIHKNVSFPTFLLNRRDEVENNNNILTPSLPPNGKESVYSYRSIITERTYRKYFSVPPVFCNYAPGTSVKFTYPNYIQELIVTDYNNNQIRVPASDGSLIGFYKFYPVNIIKARVFPTTLNFGKIPITNRIHKQDINLIVTLSGVQYKAYDIDFYSKGNKLNTEVFINDNPLPYRVTNNHAFPGENTVKFSVGIKGNKIGEEEGRLGISISYQ